MPGMIDYHMHSILSDGRNTYEEMILTAIEKGLDEVGLTDHVCLKPVPWAIAPVDMPVMTAQILELREKYRDRIKVRYGIEMDYFPGREEELEAIIESLPLDYVIGSVHFIGDWNFDGDQSLYGKWTNDELYNIYFELVQLAAKSRLFDIIGHFDIIKKFSVYPESDQSRLIETTLSALAENGLTVEMNTGGLDRPCADYNPGAVVLKQCRRLNIPVTLSSDAHQVEHVARHFEPAVALLREIGFTELATFRGRKRGILRL
ncbi:MAG: histidinol-phosphatase HisJ family protein [Prolixibacteraceae bacterium]